MKDEHPAPPIDQQDDHDKDLTDPPQPAAKRPLTLVLHQTKKKKKRATKSSADQAHRSSSVAQEFGADPQTNRVSLNAAATTTSFSSAQRNEPLVIPALNNTFQRGATGSGKIDPVIKVDPTDEETNDDDATAAAVRALQEQAGVATTTASPSDTNLVVVPLATTTTHRMTSNAGKGNNELSETQHYHAELQRLPEALSETAEAYERVPIAEFGAALLRGMGWQGDNNSHKAADDDERTLLPRPQRLGLGAIPVAQLLPPENVGHRRPRGPEQYQRQQAQHEQNLLYQKEHAARVAADRQQTLQNGSLVRLHHGSRRRRARIQQLVGVPGLNRVAVVLEASENDDKSPKTKDVTVIARKDIDRLLTRQELEERPFQEPEVQEDDSGTRRPTELKDRSKSSRRKEKSDQRQSKYSDEKVKQTSSSKQYNDNDNHRPSRTWLIPHIRVRVITEKLGRRYYKKKGVVIDVTPVGATLQMEDAGVLDRVPERYLETALPKVGGRVMVLAGPHHHIRGHLLERNSRQGVLQDEESLEIHTVALDDMAEWCGSA